MKKEEKEEHTWLCCVKASGMVVLPIYFVTIQVQQNFNLGVLVFCS